MVSRSLKHLFYSVLATVGLVLALSALVLLAKTSSNSAELDRLSQITLGINAVAIVILVAMLLGNIWRLFSDLRKQVPGARLKGRMVAAFVGLALLPLSVVYYFSLEFINRGIDSWFSVEVEQGLDDALLLSRAALDIQRATGLDRTQRIAARLRSTGDAELLSALARERQMSGAVELVIFGESNRILALSSERAINSVPLAPVTEVVAQLRSNRPYVGLEDYGDNGFAVRAVVALESFVPTRRMRVLQALYPVNQRLSEMANSVDKSNADYQRLVLVRGPLKSTFTLTLTIVLLVSALSAIYGAFFFSRRLAAPIQQLVAGTVAVARGDLETELVPPQRDEIGVLVSSFNDMTRRLRSARDEAQRSRAQVETERGNLQTILAGLGTGVIALTPDLEIRIANSSAADILNIELSHWQGQSLSAAATSAPLLQQLVDVAQIHWANGEWNWREQIMLREERGRRVLNCVCASLPTDDPDGGGFVVVFDDITALLEAQRDAAWGEVARRLAHEIKNPLTPIQLSAERLRHRYLDRMSEDESQLLDRATHTIVQQVEAMKDMVNAFSDYARAPEMQYSRFSLNHLVQEVADLYRNTERHIDWTVTVDTSLPEIEADNGRLRQVLHNLLRNASEALADSDSGHIVVTTELMQRGDADWARITVLDDGPGFDPSAVHKVFDPYVTSKDKGTGLGLAIVRKLIEEHAGTIEAGNREGGGARVSIALPVSDAKTTDRSLHLPPGAIQQGGMT
ncbi:MAG: ATP-binding protein [Pseudomonadota bacterium]